MAKTYSQLQAQIEKLQQEAESLRKKEVADVVTRIQKAIAHYGLTQQDLFGTTDQRAVKAGRKTEVKAVVKPTVKRAANASKVSAAPKYSDSAGHTWSGIGKWPNWFKAALAAGKTAQELAIQPSA